MTADLGSQLERYTAAVLDQQQPITAADARALLGAINELPEAMDRLAAPMGRRRIVVTVAAAAVMILVLVGGVAWLARDEGSTPPAEEPTDTTTIGSWYRVPQPLPDLRRGVSVGFWDVADTPVGLLALGGGGLWNSQDGTSWEPFAREVVGAGAPYAGIASSELGTVVIGWQGTWFSADGETWSPVEHPPGDPAESFWIPRVAASSEEFVAFVDQQFWVSANGMDWQEALSGPTGFDYTSALAATPFGFFAGNANGSTIWYSPDGLEWNEVAGTGFNRGSPGIAGGISDIAGSSRGVVAVSSAGDMWFSPDGVEWQSSSVPGIETAIANPQFAVGASDTGFLIANADYDDPGTSYGHDLPGAWYSEDGLSWTLVPHEPTDKPLLNRFGESIQDVWTMRGVIPLGTGFLIIGEVDPEAGGGPVWIYEH